MKHLDEMTFRQLIAVTIQGTLRASVIYAVGSALYHQEWSGVVIAMMFNVLSGAPDLARDLAEKRHAAALRRIHALTERDVVWT
jgi:hypothetical protein